MIEKMFIINDEGGIHARPATVLVSNASKFNADVLLEYKGKQANAKSIMGVMALAVPTGAEVKVVADGEDEEQAMNKVEEVLTAVKI